MHFLLFPKYFQNAFLQGSLKVGKVWLTVKSYTNLALNSHVPIVKWYNNISDIRCVCPTDRNDSYETRFVFTNHSYSCFPFFPLYLAAFECGLANQKLCYIQIYKFWRKRHKMVLRMVGEYRPGFPGYVYNDHPEKRSLSISPRFRERNTTSDWLNCMV